MNSINNWFTRHLQNCIGALGHMFRQPVASTLTITAIGIALALPSALNIVVRNGQAIAGDFEDLRDFSVYTKPGIPIDRAAELRDRIDADSQVRSTRLISAEQALEKFREGQDFGPLVAALDSNPLPHTIVVRPDQEADALTLRQLKDKLARDPLVDLVKLDTDWLRRLNAILELVGRAVWITAILLVIAVIVVIGNTIRLDIQNRRAEIEVSKLFGASDGFVRRPFLYTGFWYGLFGGAFAVVLLSIGLWLMSGPVERLVNLYGGGFDPFGMDRATFGSVFGLGLVAGLCGAWLAVSRHLKAIQPKL